MGRQNNQKQNGTAKTTKSAGTKSRNLKTPTVQNGAKTSKKKSNVPKTAKPNIPKITKKVTVQQIAKPSVAKGIKPNVSKIAKPNVPKIANSNIGNRPAPPKKSTPVPDDGPAGDPKGPFDRSQLNFPIDIRVNGFSSMLNTVKNSTPKVQKFLLEECDIIMECKFCRNLFRSLPNFISHKQNYCRSMYSPSTDDGLSPLVHRSTNPSRGVQYQFDTSAIDNVQVSAITPLSASNHDVDINGGIEANDSVSRSSLSLYNDISNRITQKKLENTTSNNHHVKLVIEPLANRHDTIVYQRRAEPDPSICDSTNNNYDTREVIDRDTAILGPDGKVICTGTELGIERIVKRLTSQIEISQRKLVQNSTNRLEDKCDICKTVFTTDKALRQHRRDAPDCVKQSLFIKSAHSASNGGSSASNHIADVFDVNQNVHSLVSLKSPKTNEEKAKSNLFVKQVFSKPSPFKSVTSPVKSPLFAKKLISAASAQKALPFQNIRKQSSSDHKLVLKKRILSPVKAWNSSRDLSQPFSCGKCSLTCSTRGEMITHLAKCAGVINLSLLQDSSPTSTKRIGIEVRHHYSKPATPCTFISAETDATSITTACSPTLVSTSPLDQVLSLCEKPDLMMKGLNGTLKSDAPTVAMFESEDLPETRNLTDLFTLLPKPNGEISGPHIVAVTQELNLRPLPELMGETNHQNASSGSEGDQESVGNGTDSGISSATTPSDGHVSPADLQSLQIPSTSTSTRKVKTETKSKKTPLLDDRVLTPKNNLRSSAANQRKRKSTRIQTMEESNVKISKPAQKK